MKGHISEDALEQYARLAAEKQGLDFAEGETYDFGRCMRSDGTFYGTRGKCKKGTEAGEKTRDESSRKARLMGEELRKGLEGLKDKGLATQAKMIREAKARANARYEKGEDVPPLPTAPPLQGAKRLKRELKLRREEAKAEAETRRKARENARG
jgi:hypothetical protein